MKFIFHFLKNITKSLQKPQKPSKDILKYYKFIIFYSVLILKPMTEADLGLLQHPRWSALW